MRIQRISHVGYYLLFTLLMATLMVSSYPSFLEAWLTGVFLLPALVILRFGMERSREAKTGFTRFVQIFFWAVFALYMSYMALLFSYWYFLELHPDHFDLILVNPIFIWITLGFFAGLEGFLFKKDPQKDNKTITIFSNRKKTVLEVDQIAYVESRGEFTVAFLKNGSEYKNQVKISYWQQHLDHFVRIHRSFLVNPELSVLHGGSIVVHGKWELPVSRGYKKDVSTYFGQRSDTASRSGVD